VDQESDVPEVRPPTVGDVQRLCRALHEAEARYVLIGGFAVIRPSDAAEGFPGGVLVSEPSAAS